MANPRRVKMVAKQILRELSDMLLTDKVLQHAVLPEVPLGADRYLSSLTTISEVDVSGDLQRKEVAISGLKSKAKYVRGELGRRMKLRMTPEIRFIEDESIERGSRVITILNGLKCDKPIEDDGASNSHQDDDDDIDFEDDPGVLYMK